MGTTKELFGQEEVEETNQNEQEVETIGGEATEDEVKPDETEVSQEKEQENYYTPEELNVIHPTAIDLERVNPSVRPIVEKTIKEYKSVIANQTRVSQENAELKKASQKPKTIEDYFNDDPEGTITYIDQQIMNKLMEADRSENDGDERTARKLHREALQWEATKSTLTLRKSLAIDKTTRKEIERSKILAPFPDYSKRREQAEKYMSTKLMMTEKDIDRMLDVDNNGVAAVNLVNHFFDLSKKPEVKDSVKAKLIKKTPEPLGRAGSQSNMQKNEDEFDYSKEFEKAKKTGNWSKVLQHKGAA